MSKTLEAYRTLYPSDFYERYLKEQIRPDGREVLGTRAVNISTGSIGTAYGSSMVKLGPTAIVAGVQAELAFEDLSIPSQLIVNIEVGGISGTNFTGKPSESTQALSSRLNSVIKSCNLVRNLEKLCVESEDKDTKVLWYLYVDLYCLDHDGNLFDACMIALVAALKNVRLPQGEVVNGQVIGTIERPIQLEIASDYPLSLSFCSFQDYILADPTYEEENLADSNVSIVCSADNTGKLWGVYKQGGACISTDKLKECIARSMDHVQNLVAQIDSALEVK